MFQPWPEPRNTARDTAAKYPVPVGHFDAQVMQHLEHHIEGERELLGEYESLLEETDHPPVRYLLRLLLDDEQRHHRILVEMLNQFRSSVYCADEEPRVPWMIRKADPAIAATTRRLRRGERKDLHQLRALRRRLKFMRRSSLNGVLVDSLILDTRKHLGYLRTLQRLV